MQLATVKCWRSKVLPCEPKEWKEMIRKLGQKTKKKHMRKLEIAIVTVCIIVIVVFVAYELCSAADAQAKQTSKTMGNVVAVIEKNVTDAGWQFRKVNNINYIQYDEFAYLCHYNKCAMSEVTTGINQFIEYLKDKNVSVVLIERSHYIITICAVENINGTEIKHILYINAENIKMG